MRPTPALRHHRSVVNDTTHSYKERTPMIIRIVTFRLDGIDEDQYQHHAVNIADTFNRWTGLQAKLWLADRPSGVYGGVYLFDSKQAADESRSTPGFKAMLENPAFADLSVREYDVLEQLTAITASNLLAVTG